MVVALIKFLLNVSLISNQEKKLSYVSIVAVSWWMRILIQNRKKLRKKRKLKGKRGKRQNSYQLPPAPPPPKPPPPNPPKLPLPEEKLLKPPPRGRSDPARNMAVQKGTL